MRMGPSCARHRYSTETLARLCRRLMYSGQLRLPRGLAREEPNFFLPPGDFVDVVEQLEGVDPEEVARLFEAPFRAWCREQLIAVGSTPDLALCEFLMTVDSNSEAAEYLTLYLGKTEAASGATASGWEKVPKAPAGKKKGKKGTPVHSALLGFDTGTDYAMLANLDA
ncbi:hypothetical protein F751_1336 [Auxenochlorella protothecoides]|uniref:Uncharacterized protein n=1 Tax=Auxenochlorella protothecoides TaxID=3075 RepID=A0A087SEB7_AUXPR|nr:hypothetical protein F751_1336 [Auxenochlorella protothecoides]KFM24071.1 hypothetical protein F751_1336 [Auxenochlorella protothecoides]